MQPPVTNPSAMRLLFTSLLLAACPAEPSGTATSTTGATTAGETQGETPTTGDGPNLDPLPPRAW